MDTCRWQLIDALFDEAVERAVQERLALISERCGPDDDLPCEVQEMLGAHDIAGRFLAGSAADAASALFKAESPADEYPCESDPTGWWRRSREGAWEPSTWGCETMVSSISVGLVVLYEESGQLQEAKRHRDDVESLPS